MDISPSYAETIIMMAKPSPSLPKEQVMDFQQGPREEIGYNKPCEQTVHVHMYIKQTPTDERKTEKRQETGYNKSSELAAHTTIKKAPTDGKIVLETGYNKPGELVVAMYINQYSTDEMMKIWQETGYNNPSENAVEMFINESLTSALELRQETGYNKHSKLVVGSYITMN